MQSTVDMAYSELRSLVTKAARGAGLAWGMAEEAGWAAEWLARRSMPAGDWAARWLAAVVDGRTGPVEFGAALADRLATLSGPLRTEPVPDDIAAPGYILPFLHVIAQHRGDLEIRDPLGTAVRVDQGGRVEFGPSWSDRTCNWRIVKAAPRHDAVRAKLSVTLVECLEVLALRTTVPPSATSRSDAGAGTSDND